MRLDPVLFVVGSLAVWRVSSLLYAEDGPFDLFRRLRRAAGEGMLGKMLGCFWCVSVWVAAPAALLVAEGWGARLLCWPALSTGAILVQRWLAPPAIWTESDQQSSGSQPPEEP